MRVFCGVIFCYEFFVEIFGGGGIDVEVFSGGVFEEVKDIDGEEEERWY